jgi:hypothetical protein
MTRRSLLQLALNKGLTLNLQMPGLKMGASYTRNDVQLFGRFPDVEGLADAPSKPKRTLRLIQARLWTRMTADHVRRGVPRGEAL